MSHSPRFRYLVNFVNAQKHFWCLKLSKSDFLPSKHLCFSTKNNLTPSEKMTETLKLKFPMAKKIEVLDVSGNCGYMYEIFVESIEFKGLNTVKQHRLINEVLKDDIVKMHGLRIYTKIPSENS